MTEDRTVSLLRAGLHAPRPATPRYVRALAVSRREHVQVLRHTVRLCLVERLCRRLLPRQTRTASGAVLAYALLQLYLNSLAQVYDPVGLHNEQIGSEETPVAN